MIVAIVVLVLGLSAMSLIQALFRKPAPPRSTPRQEEAHRLLVKLGVIEEIMPILPAEFNKELQTYLGGIK